jgi:hypothetical protein
MHEVKIALHPEVAVTVKVNVARSPEEAELQAQGVDVMASMFEREEAGFTEVRPRAPSRAWPGGKSLPPKHGWYRGRGRSGGLPLRPALHEISVPAS